MSATLEVEKEETGGEGEATSSLEKSRQVSVSWDEGERPARVRNSQHLEEEEEDKREGSGGKRRRTTEFKKSRRAEQDLA